MRPDITTIQTGEDFKKWYWLKEELVAYCKLSGLPYVGSKFEIIERIASALDNHFLKSSPVWMVVISGRMYF